MTSNHIPRLLHPLLCMCWITCDHAPLPRMDAGVCQWMGGLVWELAIRQHVLPGCPANTICWSVGNCSPVQDCHQPSHDLQSGWLEEQHDRKGSGLQRRSNLQKVRLEKPIVLSPAPIRVQFGKNVCFCHVFALRAWYDQRTPLGHCPTRDCWCSFRFDERWLQKIHWTTTHVQQGLICWTNIFGNGAKHSCLVEQLSWPKAGSEVPCTHLWRNHGQAHFWHTWMRAVNRQPWFPRGWLVETAWLQIKCSKWWVVLHKIMKFKNNKMFQTGCFFHEQNKQNIPKVWVLKNVLKNNAPNGCVLFWKNGKCSKRVGGLLEKTEKKKTRVTPKTPKKFQNGCCFAKKQGKTKTQQRISKHKNKCSKRVGFKKNVPKV